MYVFKYIYIFFHSIVIRYAEALLNSEWHKTHGLSGSDLITNSVVSGIVLYELLCEPIIHQLRCKTCCD